jgi:hypothetical protein
MNKFLKLLIIFLLIPSCSSLYKKELEKSAKANSASERLNNSQNNNNEILKDLDD